eukprot:gnl/MRDRNA2_/MRDRNA2_85057_c0_seq2.p1 gnl/MRDRNA2_/MRDRNA2_85057_c0~~gnl/MRDRNA2_/MRDRNA2_85057_c0_seq2.p1  ORF type:complete len:578 (-),score=110.05 gnl/MRDRNA2_/MRDRNA2_85057_c0_seq2:99-1790(-)
MAAVALKLFLIYGFDNPDNAFHSGLMESLSNSAAYSGFTFVVGFLLVFRTSQAYTRFWEGATMVHNMRTEWFDACSSLIAFTHGAKDQKGAEELRQIIVRLFSLLHSCALQDIAEMEEEEFELIDIRGIDVDSIHYLHLISSAGLSSVDIVFQWIQNLISKHQDTGMIKAAPPILSRVYQELAGGMIKFSSAKKITETPFPFPYAQMIAALLAFHWIVTPILIGMIPINCVWCFIFAFISVFSLCALNLIAQEIENPFGDDANDLHCDQAQANMNEALLLLLSDPADAVPNFLKKNRPLTALGKNSTRRLSYFLSESGHTVNRGSHGSKRGSAQNRKSVDSAKSDQEAHAGNGNEEELPADASISLKSEERNDHTVLQVAGSGSTSNQSSKVSPGMVSLHEDPAASKEITLPALPLSSNKEEKTNVCSVAVSGKDFPSHAWAQLQESFDRSDNLQKQSVSELREVHVMLGQLVDMVSQGLNLASDAGLAIRPVSSEGFDTGRILKNATDKSGNVALKAGMGGGGCGELDSKYRNEALRSALQMAHGLTEEQKSRLQFKYGSSI